MSTAAIAAFASAALGATMALLYLLRPKLSLAHWSFAAGMVALAIEGIFNGLAALMNAPDEIYRCQEKRLLTLSFLPGIWLLFSLTYSRGGALDYVKKWRFPLAGMLLLPPGVAFLFHEDLVGFARLNGSNLHWVLILGWAGVAVYAFLLVGSILVVMNLERTFRAAVGTMRWRIKFMLLGVGVLFIARIYTASQALLFRGADLQLEILNSVALVVATMLIVFSFLRTRQSEADVYPSQSVLQNSITVLLAGVYLVTVGVFAKVAAYLGGDREFALKAFLALISIVALAVFLQSERARLRLRQFVSRNFQRPLYDYRTVWRRFTEVTTSRLEQADLCRSLIKLVAEMFQCLSVSIWLLDEKKESLDLVASTFLPEGKGSAVDLLLQGSDRLVEHFKTHVEPADIESSAAPWAEALREVHPSQFLKGGHRVCVPLISQDEVIGVITMGDRVGGTEFTMQDFDMLKCVGDHMAAWLRNVQLSQKLLQSKELEAFQTMAAFFVHDLKNAASTLNLMLQNLPIHFDDPEFREDSLRGMAKTVSHINRLIGRLSQLRHEQEINLFDLDLNDVVTSVMATMEPGVGSMLSKDLRPLPRVRLDREQLTKVITNLILNATEAIAENGKVKISTALEANWVVLAVADNGSGMTPEFLSKGLFRPFQTTKKNGLGIGMFQSKMIVEAHGGRIAVASEQGKGTTFQVFLPLSGSIP
jgi:putative PEP-CTERM system histidine kinase